MTETTLRPRLSPVIPSFVWHPEADRLVLDLMSGGYQWLVVDVPGDLSGKSRGRVGVTKGPKPRGMIFKSKKERQDERTIEAYLQIAINEQGWIMVPCDGPYHPEQTVYVKLTRWIALPKSMSLKKKRAYLHGRVNKRPDADNCIKQLMDAGNSVLWHDDCQVETRGVRRLAGEFDYSRFQVISPWSETYEASRNEKLQATTRR